MPPMMTGKTQAGGLAVFWECFFLETVDVLFLDFRFFRFVSISSEFNLLFESETLGFLSLAAAPSAESGCSINVMVSGIPSVARKFSNAP